jgi:hypothetical protein
MTQKFSIKKRSVAAWKTVKDVFLIVGKFIDLSVATFMGRDSSVG